MPVKAWQAALAVGLLVLLIAFLGFHFLGPQGSPRFDRSPAGSSPVRETGP